MVCSICNSSGHNKRTCINKLQNTRILEEKYTVYVICKDTDIFNEKVNMLKEANNIDTIYHIEAQYLKENERICNKLKTRYNTSKPKIISKLGCIASHKNALLSIDNNQTINNLILEEDSILNYELPDPPEESCYMGGWICPPKVSYINKIKIKLDTTVGLNDINYKKFNILMTHALFIKTTRKAKNLLLSTILPDKIKNYDIHLKEQQIIDKFYYPPLFIQSKHISDIDKKNNNNHKYSINYGLSGETISGETKSGETISGETKSGETKSGETISGEETLLRRRCDFGLLVTLERE